MSEDTTKGPATDGQGQPPGAPAAPAAPASASGTTTTPEGQPEGGGQGKPNKGTPAEDYVFDPAEFDRLATELPENLQKQARALQKSIQAAYTKKTTALAADRKKIEAYDAFQKDPRQTLERFASQMGLKLTPAQAAAAAESASGAGWSPEKGNPENWNEVVGYVVNQISESMGSRLAPVMQQFQQIKKQSVEQQLSEIDPGWQQYEDAMVETLRQHPTMSQDPAMLYRMSVPADLLESRATQRALSRMEAKTKSSQVSGASTTTKKADAANLSSKPRSFQEAVEVAKKALADQGIVRPSIA